MEIAPLTLVNVADVARPFADELQRRLAHDPRPVSLAMEDRRGVEEEESVEKGRLDVLAKLDPPFAAAETPG